MQVKSLKLKIQGSQKSSYFFQQLAFESLRTPSELLQRPEEITVIFDIGKYKVQLENAIGENYRYVFIYNLLFGTFSY